MTWTKPAQQITITIACDEGLARVQVTGPDGAWGAALNLNDAQNCSASIIEEVNAQLGTILCNDPATWPGGEDEEEDDEG